MDSIATARDFFINQQGMSPDQADMLVSQGLQAYNQQTQPQSMMQMASNGGRIGFSEGGLSEYELLKLKELGYNVKKEGTETFGGVSVLKDILKVNKLAGGGIARLGYQMGGSPMGVEPMPMDFGQPLQVPPQQQPSFSSARSITMNPLASYGEPQLGSGTPLMMQGGGIARLGYQTGGVTLPSQGSEMSQMQGMDQEQALQTIIQILIENGIPPEQAQQLALQLLQIFSEGGEPALESFGDQLEQEEQTQMMAGGGIAGLYPREGYFLGKIVKGVGKAIKGVGKAVKSVVKSPIGKVALAAGALYFAPLAFGAQSAGLAGYAQAFPGVSSFLLGAAPAAGTMGPPSAGLFGVGGSFAPFSGKLATGIGSLAKGATGGNFLTSLAGGALGGALGGLLAPKQENETDEDYAARRGRVGPYLREYYTNLNPNATPEQTDQFVRLNTTEYGGAADTFAQGGVIGYARGGTTRLGYRGAGMVSPRSNPTQQDELNQAALDVFKRPLHQLTPEEVDMLIEFIKEKFGKAPVQQDTTFAARGGSMVPPARQIEGGIIELDARKTGGYIPYGKKERVDDVPAMLAKDEFVFTSRAVKAAGGGSAKQGAAKMYKLMKQLEAKGRKMERGARA